MFAMTTTSPARGQSRSGLRALLTAIRNCELVRAFIAGGRRRMEWTVELDSRTMSNLHG